MAQKNDLAFLQTSGISFFGPVPAEYREQGPLPGLRREHQSSVNGHVFLEVWPCQVKHALMAPVAGSGGLSKFRAAAGKTEMWMV
ncbi:hypothetical protein [Metarhizobium album]|uniref:hypothetical protein n=1 Tax=Metarhizobium album TaxID=2182425 RepID=UPI000FFE4E21|nr:hypothetical protein [Rhizobium album]